MARYIDAEEFSKFIIEHLPYTCPSDAVDAYGDVLRMLEDEYATPTIQIQPCDVKTAKWEKFDYTDDGHPAYYCSNCHAVLEDYMYQWNNFHHCYHCGAKMDNPFPCVPLKIKREE